MENKFTRYIAAGASALVAFFIAVISFLSSRLKSEKKKASDNAAKAENMKPKWRRSMKSKKTSGWSKRRLLQRAFLLPLILMSVLSVSTGCQTGSDASGEYKSVVIGMVPELPILPELPAMSWEYQDGRYSISAGDADLFLDYGENQIPLYLHEMEIYQKKMSILLEALKH